MQMGEDNKWQVCKQRQKILAVVPARKRIVPQAGFVKMYYFALESISEIG
jgi:hypothetical protein